MANTVLKGFWDDVALRKGLKLTSETTTYVDPNDGTPFLCSVYTKGSDGVNGIKPVACNSTLGQTIVLCGMNETREIYLRFKSDYRKYVI